MVFITYLVCVCTWVLMVSSQSSLQRRYKRTQSPCTLQNDIYLVRTARSAIECAVICEINNIGTCSRYQFDSNDKTCRLHSDVIYPGITPVTEMTDVSMVSYGTAIAQCLMPGYDFIPFANRCIRHFPLVDNSWKGARNVCQHEGGDLMSITTAELWIYLKNYMNCATKFWAGLKNMRWANGEAFSNIYGIDVIWNNLPGSEFPDDTEFDCGFFTFRSSPHLVDVSCNHKIKRFFICEIPLL